jgi:hypothetical protein
MSGLDNTIIQYVSGADVTLGFGDFRFRFALDDFGERVRAAAVQVGCINAGDRTDEEIADLVSLAATGRVPTPVSPLGHHVERNLTWLVDREGDVVYWLRRLIFRDAWLDQQIKEGRIDPVFDANHGFGYVSSASHEPVADPNRTPDWSPFMYRGDGSLGKI